MTLGWKQSEIVTMWCIRSLTPLDGLVCDYLPQLLVGGDELLVEKHTLGPPKPLGRLVRDRLVL